MKRTLREKATRAGQQLLDVGLPEETIINLQKELIIPGHHHLLLSSVHERHLLYQTLNVIGMFRSAAYASAYDQPELHVTWNLYNSRATIGAMITSLDDLDLLFIDLCNATTPFLGTAAQLLEFTERQTDGLSVVIAEYVH